MMTTLDKNVQSTLFQTAAETEQLKQNDKTAVDDLRLSKSHERIFYFCAIQLLVIMLIEIAYGYNVFYTLSGGTLIGNILAALMAGMSIAIALALKVFIAQHPNKKQFLKRFYVALIGMTLAALLGLGIVASAVGFDLAILSTLDVSGGTSLIDQLNGAPAPTTSSIHEKVNKIALMLGFTLFGLMLHLILASAMGVLFFKASDNRLAAKYYKAKSKEHTDAKSMFLNQVGALNTLLSQQRRFASDAALALEADFAAAKAAYYEGLAVSQLELDEIESAPSNAPWDLRIPSDEPKRSPVWLRQKLAEAQTSIDTYDFEQFKAEIMASYIDIEKNA